MEDFDALYDSSDSDETVVNVRLPKRYIRDFDNPLEFFRDVEFKRRYRFSKDCVINILLPLVTERLQHHINNRGLPISPILQLLVALRFYASNSFQVVHGDIRGISQSSISRIVKNVSICLAEQLGEHVHFPRNANDIRSNTASFYGIAQFPNISGCIDCTHIAISNPGGENAEVFRNRKGWFSLNVQVVAGPNLEILDIVVRHPGSTHDSVIFDRSAVRVRFELNQIPGILLGDGAYPCRNYLLTPVLNPNEESERRYNTAHIRSRNVVERVFGVWKRKFSCLRGTLRTKLRTSVAIVCATAVLYNIGIRYNENDMLDDDVYIEDIIVENNNDGDMLGIAFRRAFIATHFA